VEEVIRDMGFRESELDIELVVKVIGALLGDDGMEILESTIRDREETKLRDISLASKVFKAAKDRDVTRTSVSIIVPGPAVTTLGYLRFLGESDRIGIQQCSSLTCVQSRSLSLLSALSSVEPQSSTRTCLCVY
jgi:hypothetical protein